MSFGQLGLAAFLVYLALLAGIAELARRSRRDASSADHFLAGRELGVLVLFLTLYATAYSGNSLLGYPGEAYRRGFSWIMSVGFMMSIIVVFHAVVPKLRPIAVRHGFETPGDWVRHRFGAEPAGRALVRAVALLMTVALANFLFAQLKAMGVMAELVTGGIVGYETGVIVLAAAILVYETLGGMRAVAWTDTAQGLLMMVGLLALLLWLLGETGGVASLSAAVLEVRPEVARVPPAAELANWASTIVLLGLASTIYPQAIQRVYAARDGRALKRSFALMTFMPLTTTFVVFGIGIAAIPRLSGLGHVEADGVLPLLLGQWAAEGPGSTLAAVVVFMGALAAIMSTADSVLLSLGSVVSDDLLARTGGSDHASARGKRIAALALGIALILALVARDVTLWGAIELKMELLIQCAPAFVLALHWRGLRAGPVLAGICVGTAIAVTGVILEAKRISGVHIGVIGLAANGLVAIGGSWLAPQGDPPGTGTPAGAGRSDAISPEAV